MLKDLFFTVLIKLQDFYVVLVSAFRTLPGFKRGLLLFLVISLIPGYLSLRFGVEGVFTLVYNRSVVAARPSFTNPNPIRIGKVEVLPVSDGIYSAYVEVENQNLDLVAKEIPYLFRFYNSSNEQVYSSRGFLHLVTGEKKFVILPRFTSSETVTFAKFELSEVKWQKRFMVPKIQLSASSVNLSEQTGTSVLQLSGTVQNNSPYVLKTVKLQFFLFDSFGKIRAVSSRDEFALRVSERRSYNQLVPNINLRDVSRVSVFVDTDPLDIKNLSPESGGSSSGSNLGRPEREGF